MNQQSTINQYQIHLETAKNGLITEFLKQEAALNKELMKYEFDLNMQIRQSEVDKIDENEKMKEDRKDERTRIQATQQSELIEQRKKGTPPKKFESSGNDALGPGANITICWLGQV